MVEYQLSLEAHSPSLSGHGPLVAFAVHVPDASS